MILDLEPYDEIDTTTLRGKLRRATREVAALAGYGAFVILASSFAYSAHAFAQDGTSTAANFCTSGTYSVIAGIVYIVCGVALLGVVASVFGGAGAFSLSWVSRSLSKVASKALFRGIIAMIVLLFSLFFIAIFFNQIPISVPSECYIPLS